VPLIDLHDGLDRLDNEDERDESGKGLFGEARDVGDEEGGVQRDEEEQDDGGPHEQPEASDEEVEAALPAPRITHSVVRIARAAAHQQNS